MRLFTIGSNEKPADVFFTLLKSHEVERIIDVRLNNNGTYAGFTRFAHLPYFLKVHDIDYIHLPGLAPTKELFNNFVNEKRIDWPTYKLRFESLMAERQIERIVERDIIDGGCLLCSEPSPNHCHRRLVAEHFRDCWGDLEIEHL